MKLKVLILVIALSFLSACANPVDWFLRLVPNEDALARNFIEKVRGGQYDSVAEMLGPNLKTGDMNQHLENMHRMFNQGQTWSLEPVNMRSLPAELTGGESGVRRTGLTYQIRSANSWAIIEIVVDTAGGKSSIVGINYQPLPKSLAEINAFTFKGKSLIHYLFFGVVLLYPVFIIYTIVRIVKSKVKRKWLWIPLTLIGICQFSLNWTTGEFGFQPISFHIPGVGFFRPSNYGAWFLFVCIPVGAIAFFIKRHRLQESNSPDVPEPNVEGLLQ